MTIERGEKKEKKEEKTNVKIAAEGSVKIKKHTLDLCNFALVLSVLSSNGDPLMYTTESLTALYIYVLWEGNV